MDREVSSRKFPKQNDEGIFRIALSFTGNRDGGKVLGVDQIRRWISTQWMPKNRTWEREWRTGEGLSKIIIQFLQYDDIFIKDPQVVGLESGEILVVFEGVAGDNAWKDWLYLNFFAKFKERFSYKDELQGAENFYYPD